MESLPEIGQQVYMPRRPQNYLSERHPNGNRHGVVIEHPDLFPDMVRVRYQATDKAKEHDALEMWQWLQHAETTTPKESKPS